MRSRSFGLIFVMGSLFDKLRLYFEKINKSPEGEADVGKIGVKSSERQENEQKILVEKTRDCKPNEDLVAPTKTVRRRPRPSAEEMRDAKIKMTTFEQQLTLQKAMVEEHQAKMSLLEQLIKRQCLVMKENDDKYGYEQLVKTAPDTQTFWERVEKQLSSMIEKKSGYDDEGDETSLAKIKHQCEAQRLQLREHGQCIKKHDEQFEDQLARIEMMREMLDENSNTMESENSLRLILEDHEKRLSTLEDRMARYEKQVERRLAEQHQLLIFTWLGLITTFVLCFAIVCSCCWFR